jgi:hypothetical protein
VQAVQSAISSRGVNVSSTVLSVSETNPKLSEAALRTALNVLGAGSGAAAAMITSFAQGAASVADCDLDAGKQMAAALRAVLKDPAYAALATNAPQALALALGIADSIGVTTFGPTGTPTASESLTTTASVATTSSPLVPTFANFGSIVGTGASTSPAR